MDEIQTNCATGEEEIVGDDFYEKIEAPKFVDLSAPDRCRAENDDRYWFCLRVGCDQKHEEELDSEAIYRNFVLRVMAARSPSVRLRKALYSRDTSSNLQCPRTVPAKSSKSRVSRLAMISSISQKMGEAKVKVGPVPKQNATTPNVKAAKQTSIKAFTTPKNRKRLSNPGTFRSVRNPKPTAVEVPKNKVVAKALVFHSPKKAVKLKKSVELSGSLRKICAGLKKLEIADANKKNTLGCNKPLDAPRKQLRGREVKSRVYDSLHSQNQKKHGTKSSKCLKKKNEEKELKLFKGPMSRARNERDSTDKEIEAKDGSLEVCSTSGTSKNPSGSLEQEMDEEVKLTSDTSRSNLISFSDSKEINSGDFDVPKSSNGGHNGINERSSLEENIELCSTNKEIPEAVESEDKENALASQTEPCSTQREMDEEVKLSSDTSRSNLISFSDSKEINSGDFDVPKSSNGGHNGINERSSLEENIELYSTNKEIPEAVESEDKENALASQTEPCSTQREILEAVEIDDKENALASHTEVSESNVMEIDDKENASASDENRKLSCTTEKLVKKDVLGKHETSKNIQKVSKVMSKTPKENSTSAVKGTQGIKYRKPKPTNPKPFRLRTDERGILKEANLEKKQSKAPLKETTIPASHGEISWRKHQNVQKNEGSENESDISTLKYQPKTMKSSCSRISKGNTERKLSTTIPQKRNVPLNKKAKIPSLLENSQAKAAQNSEDRLEKTKSPSVKQLVRPRGVASSRKKLVSLMKPGQLAVLKEISHTTSRPKETSEPNESRTSLATKVSASNASRPSPQRRRHTTIPKEPNFHSIHVPKSCTKKVL